MNEYEKKKLEGDEDATFENAKLGTDAEHALTLREAFKMYPKAIAWSLLLSSALIMEGYDTALLSSFYAYPAFINKFGTPHPVTGVRTISAAWQAGLSNGTAVGQIVGLILNGFMTERWGYKITMCISLVMMTLTIFIPFFAPNIQVLLVAQIFEGIPWGVFQTLTTAYASELLSTTLRPYLTTYVNLAWAFGNLSAAGVLRGFLPNKTEWGYRIPYALQWIWPVPILIGCLFAPESPWWLVRKGRVDEARDTLVRLVSKSHVASYDPEPTIAMIMQTNEFERQSSTGTSYKDCFRGTNLRRTEIACITWMIQNLCGSTLQGYTTFFLTSAGMPTTMAFNMSIIQNCVGVVGTVSAWFLLPHVGRRKLYLYGLLVLEVLLVVIGSMGFAKGKSSYLVIGVFLVTFQFVYAITIGPICYALVAEMSATRLRSKTTSLARICYKCCSIFNGTMTPRMLNKTAWNWGAKAGLFWVGVNALCIVYTFFRLPEPKDRTYGELDALFEHKVSARKFSSTDVNGWLEVSPMESAEVQPTREMEKGEKSAQGQTKHIEHA